MDAPAMTVWLVALQGGRRLELEGDAGLLGDLLRCLRAAPAVGDDAAAPLCERSPEPNPQEARHA